MSYKVFIHDEFNPEDNAMLQALYSRSAKSVAEHVDKVKASGSGKFMERYYVGYGHKSIADCGSTTMFIEGLSVLADKALQDWPLYAGQETSTRYVDMAKQPIVDPINNHLSKDILQSWMDFYIQSADDLEAHLKAKYPRLPDEDEKTYNRAIQARSFDIRRAFLPAGITTQLSWHTNLRQAHDKLSLTRHHPLPEVRKIAKDILGKLREKYSHSFSHKHYQDQEDYRRQLGRDYSLFNPSDQPDFSMHFGLDQAELSKHKNALLARPQKTNLPLALGELGVIRFDFLLDYGSFRDIQRHRNGTCRMPLLDARFGFHEWYLNQLPEDWKNMAEALIDEQKQALNRLEASPAIKQYYTAMGFKVPCRVAYGLPAAVYVIELRSGKPVHPTLRQLAHKMHHALQQKIPYLKLHSDLDPSDWDVRRGKQTIEEKQAT